MTYEQTFIATTQNSHMMLLGIYGIYQHNMCICVGGHRSREEITR